MSYNGFEGFFFQVYCMSECLPACMTLSHAVGRDGWELTFCNRTQILCRSSRYSYPWAMSSAAEHASNFCYLCVVLSKSTEFKYFNLFSTELKARILSTEFSLWPPCKSQVLALCAYTIPSAVKKWIGKNTGVVVYWERLSTMSVLLWPLHMYPYTNVYTPTYQRKNKWE